MNLLESAKAQQSSLDWAFVQGRPFNVAEDRMEIGTLIRFYKRAETKLAVRGVEFHPAVYLVTATQRIVENHMDRGFGSFTEVTIKLMRPDGVDEKPLKFSINSEKASSLPYSAFEIVGAAEKVVTYRPVISTLTFGEKKAVAEPEEVKLVDVKYREPRYAKNSGRPSVLASAYLSPSALAKLSPRFQEVFKLFQQKRSVMDIAREIGVSPRTVETYQTTLKKFVERQKAH